MPKRAMWILVLLLGAGVAGFLNSETTGAAHQEGPMQLPLAYVPSGRQMFKEYCAACHGADGKGRGPASASLRVPPADLTTLSQRYAGNFPVKYVTHVLRFGPGVSAHGSGEMPVW